MNNEIPEQENKPEVPAGEKFAKWVLLSMVAFILVGIMAIQFKDKGNTQVNLEDELQQTVRNYLRVTLADRKSYEGITWSDVTDLGSSHSTEHRYTMRHKFRAKNSFGGYVITHYRFFFDDDRNIIRYENLDE